MLAADTQLERDSSITEPIAQALAEQMVRSAGQAAPEVVNLADRITGIGESLTMQGAPQLQINLMDDENFALLESGFWGSDATHGRLRSIEINYPVGSKYWWRLRQVSPKADFSCETYWIPRVVRELMDIEGPFKASRGSRTRAEFLKMCCDKVPDIRFHCKQLDIKQPIANVKIPKSTSAGSAAKSVGLTAPATKGLTVKGSAMTAEQRDVAGTLLQVCDKHAAGKVATVAMIYAAIWESGLSPHADNGSFWGVLSGSHANFQKSDTVGMAEAFLDGGKGFKSAKQLANSNGNPAAVASQAEGAIPYDSNGVSQQYHGESGYPGDSAAVKEAEAIVQAGGGATGTGGLESGTETVQQYNFEIGTTEEPYESFWTGMNRLAQEVNWELVVDGPDIYYDRDETLCRFGVVDVIDRTDDNVADWEYDWDDNNIATNLTLVLICDEFAGKPPEFSYAPPCAIQLGGFGPASKESTIGLEGRWLVGEVQRNPGDIVATLTLVQPTKPLKEPAPTISSSSSSGTGGSSPVGDFAAGSVLAALQAGQQLSGLQLPYSQGFRTLTQKPPAQGYDCSAGVSWVLLKAGFSLPGGVTWDQWAPVTTNFEQWGEPGPGKEMTVWCNADHMFIEFNVSNIGHMGFDSGHPSSEAAWFGSFRDSSYVSSGAFVARHWPGT